MFPPFIFWRQFHIIPENGTKIGIDPGGRFKTMIFKFYSDKGKSISSLHFKGE